MKAVRIIVIFAVLVGGGIYYYNFSKKKTAIEANNLAKQQIEKGDYTKALAGLDKAYKGAEKYPEIKESMDKLYALAYFGHGKNLEIKKKYTDAIAAYKEILKYSSDEVGSGKVNFNIGHCYANLKVTKKNTRKAIDFLGRALKDNPKNSQAKFWLKRCQARMEGIPLNKKALAAFRKGDFKTAKSAFSKLSKNFSLIAESKANPWYYLSQIAVKENKGEEALKKLKKSVKEQGKQVGMKEKHKALLVEIKKKFPDLFKGKNGSFSKLID